MFKVFLQAVGSALGADEGEKDIDEEYKDSEEGYEGGDGDEEDFEGGGWGCRGDVVHLRGF